MNLLFKGEDGFYTIQYSADGPGQQPAELQYFSAQVGTVKKLHWSAAISCRTSARRFSADTICLQSAELQYFRAKVQYRRYLSVALSCSTALPRYRTDATRQQQALEKINLTGQQPSAAVLDGQGTVQTLLASSRRNYGTSVQENSYWSTTSLAKVLQCQGSVQTPLASS